MPESDRQEQRDRIAGWVREGKQVELKRKERNHALIHLGLAVLAVTQKGGIEIESLLPHIPENKHDLIRRVVTKSD